METTELTEYEQNRAPQVINMDSEMAISLRSLQREIVCPICLDILKQTMATRECLHRFCSACINKALRSSNKECPTCRKRLTARNCLAPDTNFDQLIANICNVEQDRLQQDSSEVIIAPECEIILRPLNGQRTRFIKCSHKTTVDHLSKYLAMRPESSKMPELDTSEEYKLCIVADRSQGQYKMLSGSSKLEDIKRTYNLESNKPLELYFYVPPTS